ncbi:hypothetical protein ACFFRR_010359, partial [Megaselia abdita]
SATIFKVTMLLKILVLLLLNFAIAFCGKLVPIKSICEVHKNTRLANPNDCSKYYDCNDGKTLPGKCRESFLFDPVERKCVQNFNETQCINYDKKLLSAEAYGFSCKQYILWFNGKGVIRQCGDGLTFNEITTRCDFEEKVECVDTVCNHNLKVANVRSPQSCTRYFLCFGHHPIPMTCPKGFNFYEKGKYCSSTYDHRCTLKPQGVALSKMPRTLSPKPCPKTGFKFFPDKNTNKYIVCSFGKGTVASCSKGLVYHHDTKSCGKVLN